MRTVLFTLVTVLFCANGASAEDKVKSRDDAVKKLAEDFARAMTVDKDHKKALSLTHVPFVKIEYGNNPDFIAVLIKDADKLKKRLTNELELRGDESDVVATKIYVTEDLSKVGDRIFKVGSQVLKKSDRIVSVEVRLASNPSIMEVLVLTSWVDDEPKVVGCGYFYAR